MYPPFTAIHRELEKPIKVGNTILSTGTEGYLQVQICMRDEKIFPQPDEFIPERWVRKIDHGKWVERCPNDTTAPGEIAIADRNAFFAFGGGGRNCVAEKMAIQEMRIVVANIMYHFELELYLGYELRHDENDNFRNRPVDGMPMLMTKRKLN